MAMSESEIKNLVLQSQQGDRQAFVQIYNLFFAKIYKFVFFRTKQKEDAEDLTCLVFLKVWQHLAKYRFKKNAKFSTWLFQIARFTLIDYYRQQKPSVSLDAMKELKFEDAIQKKIELEEIKKALKLLPEAWQTAVNLRYFGGFSYQEIAQIMGKTSVGVRVLVHRALKKIGNLIKHGYDQKSKN